MDDIVGESCYITLSRFGWRTTYQSVVPLIGVSVTHRRIMYSGSTRPVSRLFPPFRYAYSVIPCPNIPTRVHCSDTGMIFKSSIRFWIAQRQIRTIQVNFCSRTVTLRIESNVNSLGVTVQHRHTIVPWAFLIGGKTGLTIFEILCIKRSSVNSTTEQFGFYIPCS